MKGKEGIWPGDTGCFFKGCHSVKGLIFLDNLILARSMVSGFAVFCAPADKQNQQYTNKQHTILEHKAVCIMLLGSKDLIIGHQRDLSTHMQL